MVRVTQQDIASLEQKLNAFSETLSPGERGCRHAIAARATAEQGDDVQGFTMLLPGTIRLPGTLGAGGRGLPTVFRKPPGRRRHYPT